MDYTNTTDPPPRQLFQASTSPYSMPLSEFASIVAHFDNKSGQHIVLWRAILQVFNNAIYIDNGGEVVSFLVDEDFNEILPERILYHPGVTLKVIVAPQPKDYTSTPPPAFRADTDLGPTLDPIYGWSSSNVASSQINPGFPRIVIAETQDKPSPLARGDFSSGVDIRHQVPSPAHILFAAQVSSTEANLVGSCFLKQEKQPYHQSFSKKDLCLQDLAAGQMQVANLIDNHFKKVLVKLDKTETLSEQSQELQQHMNNELHQTRRELHQTRKELRIAQNKLEQIKSEQQDMHKELMEKQQQLNESQQQAMDRLALIQNRVHAVITQTYELHEYSIPRLFIILPKERRKRDKFSKPFSKMFRLYFLCECGAHTKTEGSKISHQIHLAKHDGYDIEKPDEFIEKYGSYVLTILQMVKYGFIAAGVALPALGHIKIIEGIDAIRRKLDIPKATIGSLIDESISFISEQTANTADRINLALDGMELDKQEVLEGANLRQLKSYLKVNDASRVLGNMYRIVTMEGHVKWVCMDHYNDIHELSAIKGLREIVQAMGGNFVVEEGSITVKTDSSIQAEQFYAALVKARCAQLLNIELNWEVTQEDLQALATAATKARVINFRLSGCLSRDLVGVPINRTLFQPVLELMSNGVIQTVAFSDIYNRDLRYGDAPSMRDAPGLRELTITDVRFFELQSFAKVLEHCQSLTRLRMRSDVVHEVFDLIRRDKSLLPQLSILELEQSEEYCYLDLSTFHLIIHFSEGRIESVEVAQFAISYFVNEMTRKFLLGGHLSKMSILFYGDETDEERYMDIIRHNPMLTKLDCHALGKHVEIIDWTVAARRDVLASRLPAPMLTFEGVSTNYECEQDDEYHMCYSLEFEANSSTFDISSDIAPQKSIQEDLLRFCRIYGWSITEWYSILLLTDADASLPLKWMKIIDIIEHPQDVSTRFVQLKQRAPEAQLFVEL
ncbi:hypothetical protein BGZ99_000036 [Dissophora globulifera]|uniref:Uncharacterized protein n=1 Tax=Dissophora globulifera TaxID=979702 RepID=A0A9P6V0W2_9FUNG|nr:hypothetical protein BGZ99_000036 [Dissophora globulifera]